MWLSEANNKGERYFLDFDHTAFAFQNNDNHLQQQRTTRRRRRACLTHVLKSGLFLALPARSWVKVKFLAEKLQWHPHVPDKKRARMQKRKRNGEKKSCLLRLESNEFLTSEAQPSPLDLLCSKRVLFSSALILRSNSRLTCSKITRQRMKFQQPNKRSETSAWFKFKTNASF